MLFVSQAPLQPTSPSPPFARHPPRQSPSMAPRHFSQPVNIQGPSRRDLPTTPKSATGRADVDEDELSACLVSTTISSTFRAKASEFLKKYYRSKQDLASELGKSDRVEEFELGEVIGMGAFSCVRRAANVETGEKVAVKIVSKADSENDVIQMVTNETAVWSTVEHPNIIKLIRVVETRTEICIVAELAEGGTLLNHIIEAPEGRLSEDAARPLFQQLFSVLQECHARGVVHGDIKPDNILMTKDHSQIRLCDFGLSHIVDHAKSPLFANEGDREDYFSVPKSASLSGTPLFLAPEAICIAPDAGTESDMWSAGVTLYAALTGRYPFDDDFTPRLQQKILACEYDLPEHLSPAAVDLIRQLLTKDPAQRLMAREALRHHWFSPGRGPVWRSGSGCGAPLDDGCGSAPGADELLGLSSPPLTSP